MIVNTWVDVFRVLTPSIVNARVDVFQSADLLISSIMNTWVGVVQGSETQYCEYLGWCVSGC